MFNRIRNRDDKILRLHADLGGLRVMLNQVEAEKLANAILKK